MSNNNTMSKTLCAQINPEDFKKTTQHSADQVSHAALILSLPQMTTIDLVQLQFSADDIAQLANTSHVHTVSYRNHPIANERLVALADALKLNTTITAVDMRDTNMSDSECELLADALAVNSTVTKVDLGGSVQRFENSAPALARMLCINSTIEKLYFQSADLGDVFCAQLCAAMSHNSSCRVLDLAWNHMSDNGAKALSNAMMINSTLEKINVSCNDITYNGLTALATALRVNTTIYQMNIQLNDASLASSRNFIDSLEYNMRMCMVQGGYQKTVITSVDKKWTHSQVMYHTLRAIREPKLCLWYDSLL